MEKKNSESKIRANNKYTKANYEKIDFRVRKGEKERLKEAVKPMSLNGFIQAAVNEKLSAGEVFRLDSVKDLKAYARSAGIDPLEYVRQAVLEKMKHQDDGFREKIQREKI